MNEEKLNQIELQSLIILVWGSEWTFGFKRDASDKLLKMLDDLDD
jgi:pyruvate dehydrogenase complex dehydrogenase (E1) component